ncbi:MAG: 2OG-Fe(II) oxygenase [Wenzhouxiangella sp.]
MQVSHVVIPNFLNDAEVNQLIEHAKTEDSESRVNRGGNTFCTVSWIWYHKAGFQTLTSRINELVSRENTRHFGFEHIAPFTGRYQYTEYHEPGDAYGWHNDHAEHPDYMSKRRLTLTIALSDEDEYAGGGFELSDHLGHAKTANPSALYQSMLSLTSEESRLIGQKGTLLMFPAKRMHRALPVYSGSRKVLVCWVSADT